MKLFFCNKKKREQKEDLFQVTGISGEEKKISLDIDLNKLYERADHELGLQQSKRDLIINIYLGMFSFLVPFTLSLENISFIWKGGIFLVTALIGFLFANIIVRYRIYKECYWLCCQTITVLFGIKPECLNKKTVHQCFYNTIYKKGKKYLVDRKENSNSERENSSEKARLIDTKKFSKSKYVFDNIFSSETIYFFIHSLITSLVFSIGFAFVFEFSFVTNVISAALGLVLFIILCVIYFSQCIKVYLVLDDGRNESFNSTFRKAWFLHFYMDDDSAK